MLSVAAACGYTSDTITAKSNCTVAPSVASTIDVDNKSVDKEEKVSEEEAAAGLSTLFG